MFPLTIFEFEGPLTTITNYTHMQFKAFHSMLQFSIETPGIRTQKNVRTFIIALII